MQSMSTKSADRTYRTPPSSPAVERVLTPGGAAYRASRFGGSPGEENRQWYNYVAKLPQGLKNKRCGPDAAEGFEYPPSKRARAQQIVTPSPETQPRRVSQRCVGPDSPSSPSARAMRSTGEFTEDQIRIMLALENQVGAELYNWGANIKDVSLRPYHISLP